MSQKWLYAAIILSVIFSACAPLGGTFEVGIIPETQETSIAPSLTPSQPSQTQETSITPSPTPG